MDYSWTPPVIEPNPIREERLPPQVFVHWEEVTVNETVVFSDGDLVLARVPIEAVRQAAIAICELTELVPFATITLAANENYVLVLTKWDDSEIVVTLGKGDENTKLQAWTLEEIDPL